MLSLMAPRVCTLRDFLLMPTNDAAVNPVTQAKSAQDWVVSCNKRFRANVLLWGMPKSLSTVEIRAKLADIGLVGFSRGSVACEGDHVRLVLLPKDSAGLSKVVVSQISVCLRKIGCRCVLDDTRRAPLKRLYTWLFRALIGFLSWLTVMIV